MNSVLSVFRRPMPNAPVLLPISLMLSWLLLLGWWPCNVSPYSLDGVLAATTVCIAAWCAHLRSDRGDGARSLARAIPATMLDLLKMALVVITVSAIAFPTYQCATERTKIAELIIVAASYRNQINERYARTHEARDLGANLNFQPSGRATQGLITADGSIVLLADEPPAVLMLTPHASGTALTWQCRGVPARFMPAECR